MPGTDLREEIYWAVRDWNCGDRYDAKERAEQVTDDVMTLIEEARKHETIMTTAELDTFPVGTVLARLHWDGQGNSVYTRDPDGWRAATEKLSPRPGDMYDQNDELMAPLIVLYRPDQGGSDMNNQKDFKYSYATHEWVGVLTLTAEELRDIASALGWHDAGMQEMNALADKLDKMNENDYG